VNLDNEISKCDKKLDLARLNLHKIVKLESQSEYSETVPANVQAANAEKVTCSTVCSCLIYLIYYLV